MTLGFDGVRPIKDFPDLQRYHLGILPKVREKFSTTETEHELFLTLLGGSLPNDAFYFCRFTLQASDVGPTHEQVLAFEALIEIFNQYLPGHVVRWGTDGGSQVCPEESIEHYRQEYLFKQNYCAELARKKWVPPIEGTRFCAYCLIQIDPGSVKKCGGCKKRAYCSKECQIIDWKSDDGGQNHKYWCKVGEGIDWEVVETPGKGLGIVAKTFIPRHTRVIVEPDRLTMNF